MAKDKIILNEKRLEDPMVELVIARIDAQLPSEMKLFVGNQVGLTKKELISHIKAQDEIGKELIESHRRFLKAVTSGELVNLMNAV